MKICQADLLCFLSLAPGLVHSGRGSEAGCGRRLVALVAGRSILRATRAPINHGSHLSSTTHMSDIVH